MTTASYLDQIALNAGMPLRDRAISNTFYGLDPVGRNAPIPVNRENHGYTFFTRPMMNMSYNNLIVNRVLSNLLSENPKSLSRMIRATFDPYHQLADYANFRSEGIDNLNPFIPLLSNNLISLSGWPDFTLNTHTSQPGLYREAYSYVDDIPYNYEVFDLQASFRNLSGDPISFMMLMWGWYMGLVYEGVIMPYPELILLNEIDYNTRIYRLIMNADKTHVTRIGATGAAFPITAPIGNIFNFEGDGSQTPFTTANDQISVNFRCMGFIYYDNILVYQFNRTMEIFNANMSDRNRENYYVKLHRSERDYFRYSVYPRINPETMELEWWVDKTLYNNERGNIF